MKSNRRATSLIVSTSSLRPCFNGVYTISLSMLTRSRKQSSPTIYGTGCVLAALPLGWEDSL